MGIDGQNWSILESKAVNDVSSDHVAPEMRRSPSKLRSLQDILYIILDLIACLWLT
jgi:hypothetical protein